MTINSFSGSKREVVEAILESAAREPESWEVDNYRAIHKPSGIFVWIANSYYGVHVGRGSPLGPELFGGVTSWSTLFGPLIPWRRKLYDTFTELGRTRNTTDSASIVSALRVAA